MPTTNVPAPVFGPQGFVMPAESDILTGVQKDLNNAFSGKLKFGTSGGSATDSTPQGQLAASETAIIGDCYAMFLWFCSQVDPAYSTGRMQDAIGRIYYLERIPGAPTVVQATCVGLAGTVIPVGSLAQTTDGQLYVCQVAGTIPTSGSIVLPFSNQNNGPIPCSAHTLTTIYTTIPGWDTIDNEDDGALGVDTETANQFEQRRSLSTAINSSGQLPAILGAVLAVPNVLDAYVTENDTSVPVFVGGVLLAPSSIYVCVLGGSSQAVAEAIWSRKAPGCGYNGNTTVKVTDPNPHYVVGAPTYNVQFETPDIVTIEVLVEIIQGTTLPSDYITQVQNIVISAFAGTDGGARARIGDTLLASRYYGPVMGLGSWAKLINIKIGLQGDAAIFVGSIDGNVLTVYDMISGFLSVGDLITGYNHPIPETYFGFEEEGGLTFGSGALYSGNVFSLTSNDTTVVDPGTTITAFGTGTGGAGTYILNIAQTLVTSALAATAMVDELSLNINQAPSASTDSIAVIIA